MDVDELRELERLVEKATPAELRELELILLPEGERAPPIQTLSEFAVAASNKYWKRARHLDVLEDALMRIERGELQRLMVFLPPRHGKSALVSGYFTAWYLGRNPHKKVILSSYEADFAAQWGRTSRDLLEEFGRWFNVRVDRSSSAGHRWNMVGQAGVRSGGMQTAGAGGAITGKGAHCFPAGTMVTTEFGLMPIEYLCQLSNRPRVLSFNHQTQRLEWKHVIATSVRASAELVEITTTAGRRLRSTRDHQVYLCERGYTEANLLQRWDAIIAHKSDLSSTEGDSISSVEQRGDRDSECVYDIQVEGNSNFFANEILVHNCFVIDDPFKNAETANSITHREKIWDWYRAVAYTRLESKMTGGDSEGAIVLIQTRWHEDDLAGRILKQIADGEDDHEWEVINMPAIADSVDDPLGREIGEALWPEAFPLDRLQSTRKVIGSYFWNALYQQKPRDEHALILREEWFSEYEAHGQILRAFDSRGNKLGAIDSRECVRICTIDTAGTEEDIRRERQGHPSWSCVQVWDHWPKHGYMFLRYNWRGMVNWSDLKSAMLFILQDWKVPHVHVEDAHFGRPLKAELEQEGIRVDLLPTEQKSKLVRATDFISKAEDGEIFLPRFETKWKAELLDEWTSWTGHQDDPADQIDTAAYACILANQGKKQSLSKWSLVTGSSLSRSKWIRPRSPQSSQSPTGGERGIE